MVCIMIQNKTNKNVSNNNNKLIFLLSKIQALHIVLSRVNNKEESV